MKKVLISLFALYVTVFSLASSALAQEGQQVGTFCGTNLGPFGLICDNGSATAGTDALTQVISLIIGFLTIVAAIFFMFQFIIGGLGWIGASGDKQKLQQAQDRMTQGVLGLIVVVAAYGVMTIVGSVLGFNFLDLSSFVESLTLK